MPHVVHQAAPYYTEPEISGTAQLLKGLGPAPKPSRLFNAWQEEWYTELPATYEGRSRQKAADTASFRSVYQERFTDDRGRKQHEDEDRLAASSGVAERIEDVREPTSCKPSWERAGEGPKTTLNEEGGANRGRVFLLKEDQPQSRRALRDKANEQHQAPWSRKQATQRQGHDRNDESAGMAAAWAAAATPGAPGTLSQQKRKPGEGWRFIANNGEGSAGPKGLSSDSRSAKDLAGSALGSRGTISHVGDNIESDVGVAHRKDFGWSFLSTTGEGARPDGPREGFQARALRKKAVHTKPAEEDDATPYGEKFRRAKKETDLDEAAKEHEEKAAGRASGVTRAGDQPEGMHVIDGGMKERGLCKFMGRNPSDEKQQRRKDAAAKGTPFANHLHQSAEEDAWAASMKPLPNSSQGRGDRPARWVKPTRMTVDRDRVKPKVDCKLARKKAPRAAWLVKQEQRNGTKDRARKAKVELALDTRTAAVKRDHPRHGKVAHVARAQNAQTTGSADNSVKPGSSLYKYMHMQERPMPQPTGGSRGGADNRPPDTVLPASSGDVPRLYRNDHFDRSKFFVHVKEDGTVHEADHFANRYVGPDAALEAPWGVAELKAEPRVTLEAGKAGRNGYGSRKTYWEKWNEPILNNEPNKNYIKATGIPSDSRNNPTQALGKARVAEWEAEDPARKGVITV
eukprot:COSAG02_NODE_3522_length_6617_cov_2.604173_5_plen_685_part_00